MRDFGSCGLNVLMAIYQHATIAFMFNIPVRERSTEVRRIEIKLLSIIRIFSIFITMN